MNEGREVSAVHMVLTCTMLVIGTECPGPEKVNLLKHSRNI